MSVLQARARHNALLRYRDHGDPAVVTARGELAVESIADHIRKTVASAPPLTEAQRARISALLAPAGGGQLDGAA